MPTWGYIAIAILTGSALLVHGIVAAAKRWEKELELPEWFDVAGEVIAIAVASILGGVVGGIVWEWTLGFMAAFVGAWSSNFIVGLIRSRLGGKKKTDESPPSSEA